jgi:hypothetical protein
MPNVPHSISTRTHPEYMALKSHWDFLRDTYSGGREWFDDNIFKYVKEGSGEYADRIKRAYRFNHTREVVDLVVKYLFKANITRNVDDASDAVKRFWKRPGRFEAPGSIDRFMRNTATQASIYGRCYIVVDSSHPGGSISVADLRRTNQSQVYAYLVPPQRARDMAFDDAGNLLWVIIEETVRDDEDPFNSTGNLLTRYRVWTRNEWYLFGQVQTGNYPAEIIDQGTHNLGQVPVIPVDHIISDESPYSSPSMIGDVAYLDRANANYLSNLDAIIQDQTFSQLVIPAQSLPVGVDGALDEAHQRLIEMGTKRIFTYYAADGASPPHFISPDPKQAEIILAVVQRIINEIYHSVGVAGERTKQDNALGIDNSSGVAKAYDFERIDSLLTSKGSSLEAVENRLVELVEAWEGNDDYESNLVTYPDTFDTRGIRDEFQIAQNLSMIQAPDLVRRHQMEQLVEKLFPHLKKSLKDEILKGLKDWPEDPMQQLAQKPSPTLLGTSRQGQAVSTDNLGNRAS